MLHEDDLGFPVKLRSLIKNMAINIFLMVKMFLF